MPPHYPESWPSGERRGLLPQNTAPFSDRIKREIDKRKNTIKSNIQNMELYYYPKEQVLQVLEFWKISF